MSSKAGVSNLKAECLRKVGGSSPPLTTLLTIKLKTKSYGKEI